MRDLGVQCLELYAACILSQYHWYRAFYFPGKCHFLVKTMTDSVRLGVVDLNLMLSDSVQLVGLCSVKFIYSVRPKSLRSTIYLFIFISSVFLTDPQSSILDSRSLILDPGFPVNLEVFLIIWAWLK